ncbi:MAG: glutamate--tRNA ligase [Thermoplasmata archaeon]|nr:glutamate--tRNA ligase [Thermoplasmata archaeon]
MSRLEESIRKYALQNAIQHGEAVAGPVLGRIMAEFPEARGRSKEIKLHVEEVLTEVNALSTEECRAELENSAPELLEKKKKEKRIGLPELPGGEGGVVMRFAPGPSGPLHIGHTRAAVLNDEYVRKYGGRYILRLEDTNPAKIDPEAYDTIPQDMEWLGIEVHETYRQSERFPLYYEEAKKLLEHGHGYVCTCPAEEWRELKVHKRPCPHREEEPTQQLERWEKMHSGDYGEGEAAMVVKTRLDDPNPALRDFASFRIVDAPHPLTGSKYRVYPLYNFSVAVDDHHMGMTHVLRGKDHLNNTLRQEYIYRYNGWDIPHFNHYGWVSIEDTLLKTSTIKEGIQGGEYTGWDDMRLGTLKAMARRGIRPEAFRRYWAEVGIKPVDIKFSWETLYSYNKDIVDPSSPRFFFVAEPRKFILESSETLSSRAPKHPDRPEMGYREEKLAPGEELFLASSDIEELQEGTLIRLKDLGNFTFAKERLTYENNDLGVLKQRVKILHWVSSSSIPCDVCLPSGERDSGLVEEACRGSTGIVQFERYGFVNILGWDEEGAHGAYAHR